MWPRKKEVLLDLETECGYARRLARLRSRVSGDGVERSRAPKAILKKLRALETEIAKDLNEPERMLG